MSTILNALAKARRENEQPAAAQCTQLENELAYRQPPDGAQAAEQARHAGMNAGIVLGVSGAVLFLLGGVLVVTIFLFRLADNNSYAGNPAAVRSAAAPQSAAHLPALPDRDFGPALRETTAVNAGAPATQSWREHRPWPPAVSAAAGSDTVAEAPSASPENTIATAPPHPATADAESAPKTPLLVALNFESPADSATEIETAATPAPATNTTANNQAAAPAWETATDAPAADGAPQKQVVYLKGNSRSAIGSIEEVTLNGIIYSVENPRAMINDKVARVGDDIRGVKVKDIQSDHVIVVLNNVEYTLYY